MSRNRCDWLAKAYLFLEYKLVKTVFLDSKKGSFDWLVAFVIDECKFDPKEVVVVVALHAPKLCCSIGHELSG